jgi:type I restriction enzyme S subunit
LVRPRGNQLDSRFFLYHYLAPEFQSFLASRTIHGSTVDRIALKDFPNFEIALPPIEEQRAIGEVLAALDDKIEVSRRASQTLESFTQAIFNSWFVNFDPVRAKANEESEGSICQRLGLTRELLALFPASLVDTEFGLLPASWGTELMGDLCERIAMGPFGSDIKTDNFVADGVPIIRGGNLKNGFAGGDFVFLTEEKANELRNANAFPGDIVLTHRGTLGQVGLIPADSDYPRYVVSQSQLVLTVKHACTTSRYVYEYLRSHQGQHALLANTSQVGVPAIARPTTSVKSLRLLNPPIPLLQAFDDLTRPMFGMVRAETKASITVSAMRDALLSRLLSGELSVEMSGEESNGA